MAKFERVEPKPVTPPAVTEDREVRVLIGAPGAEEPYSLWVLLAETEDGFAARFTEDYDVRPESGWTLTGRGVSLVVVSVESGVMHCRNA